MEIKKTAMAGTLESSDAQVTVEPGEGKIELTIESSVIHQYGRQITESHTGDPGPSRRGQMQRSRSLTKERSTVP